MKLITTFEALPVLTSFVDNETGEQFRKTGARQAFHFKSSEYAIIGNEREVTVSLEGDGSMSDKLTSAIKKQCLKNGAIVTEINVEYKTEPGYSDDRETVTYIVITLSDVDGGCVEVRYDRDDIHFNATYEPFIRDRRYGYSNDILEALDDSRVIESIDNMAAFFDAAGGRYEKLLLSEKRRFF